MTGVRLEKAKTQPAVGSDAVDLKSLDDAALVAEYLGGRRRAFHELADRYHLRLLNFIYRTIGDRDRAEDLVQETFLAALRDQAGGFYDPDTGATVGPENLVEVGPEDLKRIELERLRSVAFQRGYKPGWVYYRYKEKFGTAPPDGMNFKSRPQIDNQRLKQILRAAARSGQTLR